MLRKTRARAASNVRQSAITKPSHSGVLARDCVNRGQDRFQKWKPFDDGLELRLPDMGYRVGLFGGFSWKLVAGNISDAANRSRVVPSIQAGARK
jgi:hypothetical protein